MVYAVDIHPAAVIGKGILLDHATGFVAGETTVIEDDVSILHEVTLGGTGKERGDRHPKIRSGIANRSRGKNIRKCGNWRGSPGGGKQCGAGRCSSSCLCGRSAFKNPWLVPRMNPLFLGHGSHSCKHERV